MDAHALAKMPIGDHPCYRAGDRARAVHDLSALWVIASAT
jgi:hypothetical protein